MEQLILNWESPVKLIEPTPREKYALVGLYAVVHNYKMAYIGKAEYQGTLKEARSHNFYESRLKEKGINWDKSQALVYIGTLSQDQDSARIDDAENLLIYKIRPDCNRKRIKKYRGIVPFRVICKGERPPGMQEKYEYPDP